MRISPSSLVVYVYFGNQSASASDPGSIARIKLTSPTALEKKRPDCPVLAASIRIKMAFTSCSDLGCPESFQNSSYCSFRQVLRFSKSELAECNISYASFRQQCTRIWEQAYPSGGGGGTVQSVALSMPAPANPAFSVAGSPVTNTGTLAVSANGTIDQYVDGTGALRTMPSTGGGGGQIFYFNGNTSQGTIAGNPYYQLGTAAGTGAAANFTRATTGAIARFITDVGSPNHLLLPSGVWTIDVYLSETGGGSNNAEIVAKLYTYNGTSFTLIGTSPVEQITNGNVIDLYTFGISVPNTVTLATDRIHIEFDIQNTNGKTVTLYTEDGRIGEVHTTYAIGISSLNGLTDNTQNFAVGTAGTDFNINSAAGTHTFNLPTASAANRGALSSADWAAFNGKQNNIGLTTVGTALATLPNPSAVRYVRINADNTATAISAATLKSELGGKQLAFKTSDQSSNILAFADVTDLSFSVVAGRTYKFKIFCQFDVTNTSTGTRWAVNGPAFTRLFYSVLWTSGTGMQANMAWQTYDGPASTANSNFTTNNCAIIEGIVVPSANGTLSARFANELTITSVTCKAGSYIEFEEI